MEGDPPAVQNVLKPMVDECIEQLSRMSPDEFENIVHSLPVGLRMMVEPTEYPATPNYICRVAEYCVAAELQKGYSPVADVVQPRPEHSEVLAVCPELQSRFDDDGLLILDDNFVLSDGGIRYGERFLYYHQFLRRGFSGEPNFSFLGQLARYRHKSLDVNSIRIAIDHRRIINVDQYRQVMELDTWYGPRFDRAKIDDPNVVGLTVVGRTCPIPLDSYPLERTEFFWKTNEGESLKTLEIEEISSSASSYDQWHINRYIHAQRDIAQKTFRHFDGAAKVYSLENYRERVDQAMPRHSRPAHYIKLFRIDGKIDLDDWLSLVSLFYKGNEMVIEYFDKGLFDEKIRPDRERMHQALANK